MRRGLKAQVKVELREVSTLHEIYLNTLYSLCQSSDFIVISVSLSVYLSPSLSLSSCFSLFCMSLLFQMFKTGNTYLEITHCSICWYLLLFIEISLSLSLSGFLSVFICLYVCGSICLSFYLSVVHVVHSAVLRMSAVYFCAALCITIDR